MLFRSLHSDAARLRGFAALHAHAQHAVAVGRGDAVRVDVVGQAHHAAEAPAEALTALLQHPGVTRVRLWRADPSVTVPSPEEKLRPGGDASFASIMVVEGTNAEMIHAALLAQGFTAAPTFYSLIYASPSLKEATP